MPAYPKAAPNETRPDVSSMTPSETHQGLVEVSSDRIVLPYRIWMVAVGLLLIVQVISIFSISKANRRLGNEYSKRTRLERRTGQLEKEKLNAENYADELSKSIDRRVKARQEPTHIAAAGRSGRSEEHSRDDTMQDTKASLEAIVSFSNLLLEGDPSDENRAIVEIINEVAKKILDTAGDIFTATDGIPGLADEAPHQGTTDGDIDQIQDLMDELQREYMDFFHEVIIECEDLISANDVEGLEQLGHRLKGNGASYGFPEISEIGAEMEKLGKACDFGGVLKCVERLKQVNKEFQTISELKDIPQPVS